MSKRGKTIFLVIVILITLLLLLRCRNDHEAELILGLHPSDHGEEILTEDFILWPGDYNIRVEYRADEEWTFVFCTDYADGRYEAELSPDMGDFSFPVHIDQYSDIYHFAYPAEDAEKVEINRITVSSDRLLYMDSFFAAAAFFAAGILLLLFFDSVFYRDCTKAERRWLWILSASVLFSSLPLFSWVAYDAHDVWGHFLRLEGVMRGIMRGQLPVVIFEENCNGFGLLGFMYPNFFLYFPAVLRVLRVSATAAFCAVLIFFNALTALTGFCSGLVLFKKERIPAALFSMIYLLFPYRMVDLYTRYAVGEIMAMTFLPLILAGVYLLFSESGRQKTAVLFLTVGMTGIIHSHVVTTLLSAGLVVLLLICGMAAGFRRGRQAWISLCRTVFWSSLLNAGYLIPFLTFFLFGINSEVQETKDFFTDTTLLRSIGLYYYGSTGAIIGLCGALTILTGVVFLCLRRKKAEGFMTGVFVLAVLSSIISVSGFPWELLRRIPAVGKITGMIQFPYRFMTVGGVLYACAAVYFCKELFREKRKIIFPAMAFLAVLSVAFGLAGTLGGEVHYNRLSGGYSRNSFEEYYPKGAHEGVYQTSNLFPSSEVLDIENYYKDGVRIGFHYRTDKENEYLDVPVFYYPGYLALTKQADGKHHLLPVSRGDEFRVRIGLPAEYSDSEVRLYYTGCWYFWIGYVISLTAIPFLILYLRNTGGKE